MSNIVIVSSYCYLLCEAINSISVDVAGRHDDVFDSDSVLKDFRKSLSKSKSSRYKTKRQRDKEKKEEEQRKNELYYQVSINFVPNGGYQNGSLDQRVVTIMVQGHDKAKALYTEMVQQIREQLPDQLYMKELVEKFLENNIMEEV